MLRLKALLLPEEPALLRSNDGPVPRRPERVGGPPLAVRMALRDLHEAAEQFEKEDAPMAIDAAATLRDRVEAEVAERERVARDEPSADVERTRRLLGESEERHKKALQEVDLLRNAVARRDTLLAEQRSAYYKDLLQYKQAERGGSPLAAPPPPPAPPTTPPSTGRRWRSGRRSSTRASSRRSICRRTCRSRTRRRRR